MKPARSIILILIVAAFLSACTSSEADGVVYNGFTAFIPLIPGYFPEEFSITDAKTSQGAGEEYWELYGSEENFILVVQSRATQEILSEIQLSAAQPPQIAELDLSGYDLGAAQRLDVTLHNKQDVLLAIHIYSNLPAEQLLQVGENLIPAVCLDVNKP